MVHHHTCWDRLFPKLIAAPINRKQCWNYFLPLDIGVALIQWWRVLLGRVDNGQIYQVARVSTFDHLLSSRPTWLTLQMVTEGKSTSDKDAVVSSIEVIGFCWGLCYLGKCLVRLFFLRWHKTRSFWINCALKGDEAVYWVSIGQRWLVLDGTESV